WCRGVVREADLPAGRFFFRAEDGIRDFHVTGVQTCALPILFLEYAGDPINVDAILAEYEDWRDPTQWPRHPEDKAGPRHTGKKKIGRAPCRERECSLGEAVAIQRRQPGVGTEGGKVSNAET